MTDIYKKCPEKIVSSLSAATSFNNELCSVHFCDAIIHFDKDLRQTVIVEGILRKESWSVTPRCCFTGRILRQKEGNKDTSSELETRKGAAVKKKAQHSTTKTNQYDTLDLARIVVPKPFVNGM
ncbi:unnamed protein product [Gongylonema pulchrum]|uniref:Uncharacterized protein n=1 Tax=Gongylonema pulchrum TaxID=637853 RepID=A0A183EEI6_9BILA|nr:unnamed protein product [Gongylonema pulchrum]